MIYVLAVSVPPTTTLPVKFPFANVGESVSPKPRTSRCPEPEIRLIGLFVIALHSVMPARPWAATDAEINRGSMYDAVLAIEDVRE